VVSGPHAVADREASVLGDVGDPVSLQQVLEVVAEFDDFGGASLGLVAWEMCVDEQLAADAWQHAISDGLIRPAGRDWQEQLWRLSSAGWAAARSECAAAPERAVSRVANRRFGR
jgi:hypothetical protein